MKTNIVIPMAGQGQRFAAFGLPKPLLPVGGKPMFSKVVSNFLSTSFWEFKFIVITRPEIINLSNTQVLLDRINAKVIAIDYLTEGPVSTCLLAEDFIDKEDSLIIVNCDQIVEDFSWGFFSCFCDRFNPDAVIGTFYSQHPKNSYIKLNEKGEVIEAKEKQVISDIATNGFHYWKRCSDFFDSARAMINADDRVNGEFYVSQTFNYLRNKKILPYHFNRHFPIGTPEDYLRYTQTDRIFNPEEFGLLNIPSLEPQFPDYADSFPDSCKGHTVEVSDGNKQEVRKVLASLGENCKAIMEIGVNRNGGRSFTQDFLGLKPKDCTYVGIDIEDKSWLNNPKANVYTIKSDSNNREFILEKLHELGVGKLSILLIDGWHSVSTVLNDWKYSTLVHEGGYIILHDTNYHPGPKELVKAINPELYTITKCFEGHPNDFGITIVRKK